MDVRMPDGSGIEACRDIREERPETKVLMLTSYADDEAVLAAIMAGASGYLLKQTRSQDLVNAINRIAGASRCSIRASPQRSWSGFAAGRQMTRSWRSFPSKSGASSISLRRARRTRRSRRKSI
jgi:DNA-binding NarL/FixJ family response regulator